MSKADSVLNPLPWPRNGMLCVLLTMSLWNPEKQRPLHYPDKLDWAGGTGEKAVKLQNRMDWTL